MTISQAFVRFVLCAFRIRSASVTWTPWTFRLIVVGTILALLLMGISKMKKSSALLFIIFVLASNLYAHRWQWVGPVGGGIERIIPHPTNPHVWFVINNDRLYRSSDVGKTWNLIVKPRVVFDVYWVADGSMVLRASNPYGIWISRDGITFKLQAALPKYPSPAWVVPNPYDANIYYSGDCDSRLGLSTDGGHTWEYRETDWKYGHNDLVVSPFDHNVLYIAGCHHNDYWCAGSLILKTDSLLRKWTVLNIGKSGGYLKFHRDPRSPDTIFFSSPGKIGILAKNGWHTLSELPNVCEVDSVPGHPQRIIALQKPCYSESSAHRIFQSNDFGKTWLNLPHSLDNTISAIAAIGPEGNIFAGTAGSGLYRLQNGKAQSMNEGFHAAARVTSIISAAGSRIYTLFAGKDVFGTGRFLYRSDDAGRTWMNLTYRFSARGEDAYECCLTSVAASPFDENLLLMSGYYDFFRSTDGGINWTNSSYQFDVLQWDPIDPHVVYSAGDYPAGVFKSTDAGITFQKLNFELRSDEVRRIRIDPRNNQLVFLITYHGLYRSDNRGQTFRIIHYDESFDTYNDVVATGPAGSFLSTDPNGGVYKTTDAGDNWTAISIVRSGHGQRAELYAADPMGQHLYAIIADFGGFRGEVFESVDGGYSWERISNQIGSDFGRTYDQCTITDMSDPRRLPVLFGTCKGVYRMIQ